MKVQDYYDLKTTKTFTSTDLYPIQNFINEDFPNIDFYNSDDENQVNTKVILNELYTSNDGYRGLWAYSLTYQDEQIALYLTGGRDGRDSRKSCITNKSKYLEAMKYLEEIYKDDSSDIKEVNQNEDLEELNEFYGTDMTQEILNVNHNFNVSVDDIIRIDIEFKNENNEPTLFKQIRARVKKLTPNTLINPMEVVIIDYKLGSEYFMKHRKPTFYFMLPKYDVFKEPEDWENFNEEQRKHIQSIFRLERRNSDLTFPISYNKMIDMKLINNQELTTI
jgi:hypothetical protein